MKWNLDKLKLSFHWLIINWFVEVLSYNFSKRWEDNYKLVNEKLILAYIWRSLFCFFFFLLKVLLKKFIKHALSLASGICIH